MIYVFIYIFSLLTLIGGSGVVLLRNPVSSALSMIVSLIGVAGLLIAMQANFLGILQILVYAGAIMVLFIFIIMLLDIGKNSQGSVLQIRILPFLLVPVVITIQLIAIIQLLQQQAPNTLQMKENNQIARQQLLQQLANKENILHAQDTTMQQKIKQGKVPQVALFAHVIFIKYPAILILMALLILIATVGCFVIARQTSTASSHSL